MCFFPNLPQVSDWYIWIIQLSVIQVSGKIDTFSVNFAIYLLLSNDLFRLG